MQVVRIGGPDDPRAADYRDVGADRRLRERGLFVAEGRLVVERLVRDRRFAVRSFLFNAAAFRALGPLTADLGDDVTAYLCETGDFAGLTGFNLHRGCLALAERPAPLPVDSVIAGARSLVVLEAVANADNIGGIFRNAAAFGAGGVVLSHECSDPLYRKAIRTSMGATLRVPFATAPAAGWRTALEGIRAAGFQLVAMTLAAGATRLDAFARGPRAGRVALVLGAEGHGLSGATEALADVRVTIPIEGAVDSLNVSVAAGIALCALRQQE
jgi:tRNA G18 (ribose-2'-O)-methylase SpoU